MLSRKSRKSAGRNQSPAKIQPSRRAHRWASRSAWSRNTSQSGNSSRNSGDIWTGLSTTAPLGSWNDPANWLVNGTQGVPSNGDTLMFPAGVSQLATTDNSGNLTLASIQFTGTGYTVSSNTGTINLMARGPVDP